MTDAERSSHGGSLGYPRIHLRRTDSTNERARELAIAGAPHGALFTADEQTSGRGRQGRSWLAPAGGALLCSLVLRDPPALLSLVAGVAACDAIGEGVRVKWPNDVVAERADRQRGATLGKLAGILVEGRPQEGWAVLGVGVNVAVRVADLPGEVRAGAASLERSPSAIEPLLAGLLAALARRLAQPQQQVLEAWRARDGLLGRVVSWAGGEGRAEGIDDSGRLLVGLGGGAVAALDAGEVHLRLT
ncbi:MAG TPA: biotin--[acetyl-CoA-carboxylase] ligase [Solirubrobacteraceae bacterium]|jgi:BirA family biotin operon repressor/biotin-[acetyl-CoA-carboxylase] ligase|nr:biotin--[acetyl-CoA-carboxylase] ligase [Solirubrobacteraceae bacterium]